MKKIVFTGGGSAGHVTPNLALIEEILQTGIADVCYMGSNGIEGRLVAPYKIPFYKINCPKLIRGGGITGFCKNMKIPFAFARAVREAKRGLTLFQPDLVFSKGGYVALPTLFAAHKLGIPCLAHESDFSAGLANRLSAKKCRFVFTSFPETAETLKNGVFSGAPMKKTLFCADKTRAKARFGLPDNRPVLLVFGGGSGSVTINTALRKQLTSLLKRFSVLHVCGKGNLVDTNLKYYVQKEFISDMGEAYACADVVLSRAGSGTIFEILALKKPSVVVPLERQTRGDQLQNAEYFQRKGLCRILREIDLDGFADAVENAYADKDLAARLAQSCFTSGNGVILEKIKDLLQ